MSQKFPITCPKCKHTWETTLAQLERIEEIYKSSTPQKKTKTVTYRAQCPVCGIFFIAEIQED